MEKRAIFLSVVLLIAVSSSVWGVDAYFLSTTGAKWSVPANWTAVPHDAAIVHIGSPPTSPSGAWATLDSAEPNVQTLSIGDASGSGRLDVLAGAKLEILQAWRTAIGAGSVATVNVNGGIINDGASMADPNGREGAPPSQWAVDGVMNYNQTGGFVYSKQQRLAVNTGSAVNIKINGGTLNMCGIQAAELDPNFDPRPVNGQLNIDIDGEGYVLLKRIDSTTSPFNTRVTINGNGKLALIGDWRSNASVGGRITTRGTLRTKYGTYAWPPSNTWKETLIFTECTTASLLNGDLNSDCRVDMRDFAKFAQNWMLGI